MTREQAFKVAQRQSKPGRANVFARYVFVVFDCGEHEVSLEDELDDWFQGAPIIACYFGGQYCED